MKQNKSEVKGCEGRLPQMAPLANPYVPYQLEDPPKYEARQALIRGTLFPGLDLPYMGMVNTKEKNMTPTTQLQTLAFAIQELALYLDTHRDDCEALEVYRAYQEMHKKCIEEYNKTCGPLTHNAVVEGPYSWLDDPWPWEYAKNKEV